MYASRLISQKYIYLHSIHSASLGFCWLSTTACLSVQALPAAPLVFNVKSQNHTLCRLCEGEGQVCGPLSGGPMAFARGIKHSCVDVYVVRYSSSVSDRVLVCKHLNIHAHGCRAHTAGRVVIVTPLLRTYSRSLGDRVVPRRCRSCRWDPSPFAALLNCA